MTKEQWGKIISALLVFMLAVLGVLGYDVTVIQPREAASFLQDAGTSWLPEQPGVVSRGVGYNTACYLEQGGSQITGDSGCTVQLNTGATLDMNAGTLRFEGSTADDYEATIAVTDPTADRTLTLPNLSGTVMLTSTPGKWVAGTNTITGTLTISHGLTTPQTVSCTLLNDPVANAAHCSATISGSTVVVKTWKSDGTTAGSVGTLVSWLIGGQP